MGLSVFASGLKEFTSGLRDFASALFFASALKDFAFGLSVLLSGFRNKHFDLCVFTSGLLILEYTEML